MRGMHSIFLLSLLTLPLIQQVFPLVDPQVLTGEYVPAPLPELTLQDLWSGDFQQGYDNWHRENFGFQGILVRMRNQKDFALFHKVHADGVLLGKNGHLYGEPALLSWTGVDHIGSEKIREFADLLVDIQNALKKRHKTLIVAIAPDAASFFPENIPDRFVALRKNRNLSDEMIATFRESGIDLIDYKHEYIDKRLSSPYPLFGKTSTHWSNYGAALSMQEFIERVEIARGTTLPHYVIDKITMSDELHNPDGDVGELCNLIIAPSHDAMALVDGTWKTSDHSEKPKLTAISDSFLWGFMQFGLAPNCFREVDFIYYNITFHRSTTTLQEPPTDEALFKSVDESDVVLIMATAENCCHFGWGFIEALHEHLMHTTASP